MNNEKSIDVLNSLVKINNDRIEGYETASNETDDTDLKLLFSQLAETSYKCKAELIIEIDKLGGMSTNETKTAGKLYRVWMDIKTSLAGNDLHTILNLCEYGEDAAIDTYENALRNKTEELTFQQLLILKSQHSILKADHDKVRAMRDNLVEHK